MGYRVESSPAGPTDFALEAWEQWHDDEDPKDRAFPMGLENSFQKSISNAIFHWTTIHGGEGYEELIFDVDESTRMTHSLNLWIFMNDFSF